MHSQNKACNHIMLNQPKTYRMADIVNLTAQYVSSK